LLRRSCPERTLPPLPPFFGFFSPYGTTQHEFLSPSFLPEDGIFSLLWWLLAIGLLREDGFFFCLLLQRPCSKPFQIPLFFFPPLLDGAKLFRSFRMRLYSLLPFFPFPWTDFFSLGLYHSRTAIDFSVKLSFFLYPSRRSFFPFVLAVASTLLFVRAPPPHCFVPFSFLFRVWKS